MLDTDNRPPKTPLVSRDPDPEIISEFTYEGGASDTDSNSVMIEEDDLLATRRAETPRTAAPVVKGEELSLSDISDVKPLGH
ncbi:hypothetical protein GMRT_14039 [Giardia muris]|uniref:Uncharacterized protein n=1 Tax=Giardia muris TaxID=5742 RepID=A0A4Z1SN76_GIAMU|nr:hypothetical protein GMRT_14039 [Giardia muris]|eukprot:TNJ27202.1 hypothetical protein GMRT_14039 [Giardia muris]